MPSHILPDVDLDLPSTVKTRTFAAITRTSAVITHIAEARIAGGVSFLCDSPHKAARHITAPMRSQISHSQPVGLRLPAADCISGNSSAVILGDNPHDRFDPPCCPGPTPTFPLF